MQNKEELDLIEFYLKEDEDGVHAISIVDEPAIESNFILFNKVGGKKDNFSKEKVEFKTDADKQIITGPALIPGKKILRKYDDGTYYNAIINEQTIADTAQRFFKNTNQLNTTLSHEDKVNETTYFESWIVTDPENDKSKALGFKDIVKGTWMVSCKIDSPELWSKIKTGDFNGFSIEAFFSKRKVEYKKINKKENMLKQILKDMSNLIFKFNRIELSDVTLKDGSIVSIDDTTLEATTTDANGDVIPVVDGDYELQDGTILTIKDGKKVDPTAVQAEEVPVVPTEEVKADTVDLTLKDGTAIYIDDTNVAHKKEDDSVLPDGDYTLIDDSTMTILNGLVQTPPVPTAEDMKQVVTEFSKVKENFESLTVKFTEEKEKNKSLSDKIVELEREIVELGKKPGAEKTPTHSVHEGKKFEEMSTAEKVIASLKEKSKLIK